MSSFIRMFAVLSVCVSGLVLPAVAAPTRAIAPPPRLVPIRAVRTTHPAALRFAAAPVFAALAVHRAPAPIRPLPLFAQPRPYAGLAGWLPRLGVAALLAPAGARSCNTARRQVLIQAVPTSPFVTDPCATRGIADDERLPPTSLVAGHNKDALYGRAYTPNADLR